MEFFDLEFMTKEACDDYEDWCNVGIEGLRRDHTHQFTQKEGKSKQKLRDLSEVNKLKGQSRGWCVLVSLELWDRGSERRERLSRVI